MSKSEENDIVLARIDERVKTLFEDRENYVTRAEFAPVQKIVYGGVGLICATIAGAVFKLVVIA